MGVRIQYCSVMNTNFTKLILDIFIIINYKSSKKSLLPAFGKIVMRKKVYIHGK